MLTPFQRSYDPNVNLGSDVIGLMPIIAKSIPIKQTIHPRSKPLSESEETIMRPKIENIKNSGGPKCRIIGFRTGALKRKNAAPIIPPITEEERLAPSAKAALPFCANG